WTLVCIVCIYILRCCCVIDCSYFFLFFFFFFFQAEDGIRDLYVTGVQTCALPISPQARLLERIRFIEAIEMGLFGAKSMHPRALEPAADRKIPVRMKNTFNAGGAGTLIIDDGSRPTEIIRSVLMVKDAGLINLTGAVMMGRPGTAARILGLLGAQGINVRVIILSVSEGGISLAVNGPQLAQARATLEANLLRSGEARQIQ